MSKIRELEYRKRLDNIEKKVDSIYNLILDQKIDKMVTRKHPAVKRDEQRFREFVSWVLGSRDVTPSNKVRVLKELVKFHPHLMHESSVVMKWVAAHPREILTSWED